MRLIAAILVLIAVLAPSAQAQGERRVALVLGNGAYEQVPGLANPRADAEAMAAALGRLGFDVELGVDLDLAGMRRVVQDFARQLQGADIALFFYAGHGMQVNGQNYLLPVDAVLESEADLDFAALPARLVLSQMERWPAVKIVMLDACRDNPFATALKRSLGVSRSNAVSRGLAPIETAGGTLLAYATDPGDVAADGEGDHSPFTAALLKHVETPGVEINTMLARVRADVYAATGQRQRPWTETSLIGEVYLAPKAPEPPPFTQAMMAPQAPAAPAPPPGLDPRAIELALWEAAQAGGTAADYQEYLRQYPEGIFARLARNRLAALLAAEGGAQGGAGPAEADGPAKRFEPRTKNVPLGTAPDVADGAGPADTPDETPKHGGVAAAPDAGQGSGTPGAAAPPSADEMPPIPKTGQAGVPLAGGADAPGSPGDAVAAIPESADAMLADPIARPTPEAVEAALGLDPGQRREVQARLLVAGHDPRGVDGIFGPGTRTALSEWQAAEGLAGTGYLDADGLSLLERRTEADYLAWVERQRREAEARQAAARAAAERRAAQAPAPTTVRGAPFAAAPANIAPIPTVPAPTPQPVPTAQASDGDDGRSVRERYEEECNFYMTGKAQLERRCTTVRIEGNRLGRRR